MATGTAQSAWLAAHRSCLLQLRELGQRLHPRYAKAPHLLVGERGEFEALFYLRRQGYLVVERRWHSPNFRGDIDLIAWDGPQLAVIEVKTRTARDLTPALSAVDDTKRRNLRDLAVAYRRTIPRQASGQSGSPIPIRFDIVSVYLLGQTVECELLRAAFSLSTAYMGNKSRDDGV